MATHPKLQSFYASKRWIVFREELILQRGLTCEHCGKRIIKASDATLHHIEELTIENVDDVSISLNPDNILIVHNGCHSEIHDRFGNNRERKVFLVYGPPLAGKNTYVMKYKQRNDLVVDVDRIFCALSGLDQYDKPNALLNNVIAVRNMLLDNIKTRYGKWNNAWVMGGYADAYKRNRVIKSLGAEAIFIEATIEECMARLEADEVRKGLGWEEYIKAWFETYIPPR